jgi:uncharacterized membrane protein YciS (DUF1049 family)
MNLRLYFRGLVFLLLFFLVLYIGMNNTQPVDFNFPLLPQKKISQPASFVFFVIFALGVIAGLLIRSGGDGKESSDPKKK